MFYGYTISSNGNILDPVCIILDTLPQLQPETGGKACGCRGAGTLQYFQMFDVA